MIADPLSLTMGGTIAVIGLGYVGLPIAVAFAKNRRVIGFDLDKGRIEELASGFDRTCEVDADQLTEASNLVYTADSQMLEEASVFIVTVPSPVDQSKKPDLTALFAASETVGKAISKGDIVIYESTVYPGCTEEDCIPVIERVSGLVYNHDFFAGYSPERINPGDKTRRLHNIVKVTSGSTPEVATAVDQLYRSIISAGTHKAESIKVAEAAKVIENTQRDLNIALVNELAIVFAKLEIDTEAVLKAAETKWNFIPFRPGLVGGHCIGVDPYYLTYKAEMMGYRPEVILAGRKLNDSMGSLVASSLIGLLSDRGVCAKSAKILVLGLTFKENCPDLRNSKVVDVIEELKTHGCIVEVFDPLVDAETAEREWGVEILSEPEIGVYDAVLLAVGHTQFLAMGATGCRSYLKTEGVFFDLKSLFPKSDSDLRL